MTSGIYGLYKDGELKYIGQSGNVERRFLQHCSLAQNVGKTPVKRWLYGLCQIDEKPEMRILEITENLDDAETRWIRKYRFSVDLLNLSDGGQTMTYLRKKKLGKPWGNTMSPIQKRLAHMKQTINILHRLNMVELEKRARRTYCRVIESLAHVDDRQSVNLALWEKYGR